MHRHWRPLYVTCIYPTTPWSCHGTNARCISNRRCLIQCSLSIYMPTATEEDVGGGRTIWNPSTSLYIRGHRPVKNCRMDVLMPIFAFHIHTHNAGFKVTIFYVSLHHRDGGALFTLKLSTMRVAQSPAISPVPRFSTLAAIRLKQKAKVHVMPVPAVC